MKLTNADLKYFITLVEEDLEYNERMRYDPCVYDLLNKLKTELENRIKSPVDLNRKHV